MKIRSNEMGTCPFCNGNDLEYGEIQLEGENGYFEWTCSECDGSGEEWYDMTFIGHNINTEDGNIEITNDMIESEV